MYVCTVCESRMITPLDKCPICGGKVEENRLENDKTKGWDEFLVKPLSPQHSIVTTNTKQFIGLKCLNEGKRLLIEIDDGRMPFEPTLGNRLGMLLKKYPFVSGRDDLGRTHCHISVYEDEVFIVDDNSSNGTFVNEKRLEPNEEKRLIPGDIICLGSRMPPCEKEGACWFEFEGMILE